MRGRNKVDVVAPEFILKIEQALRQNMSVNFIAPLYSIILAYLVVLAIDTAHIAVAEENCPRPPASGKRRFLATVSADR